MKRHLVKDRYYLPWLGFRACGEWFDVLGHALALIAGVPDEAQADTIVEFIKRHRMYATAICPEVQPGDPDWRDHNHWRNLNLPHQYQNGGIWPFIGGMWVRFVHRLGLGDLARNELVKLAQVNQLGKTQEWEFNSLAGMERRAVPRERAAT